MLAPQNKLQTSCETLEELQCVWVPCNGPEWTRDETLGLARFSALRTLTLCESVPPCTEVLHRLPTSLRELTIAAAPGYEHAFFFADRWA